MCLHRSAGKPADPTLTRDVLLAMNELPETTAEFMPMVLEELAQEETACRM